MYSCGMHRPFEIFARAKSKKYFERMIVLFGVASRQDLEPLFETFRTRELAPPRWERDHVDPLQLTGAENLATA